MIKGLYDSAEEIGGRHFAMIVVCASIWLSFILVTAILIGEYFTGEVTGFYYWYAVVIFGGLPLGLALFATILSIRNWKD